MADEDAELPMGTEEHAAQVLAPFLERHPYSKIARHKVGEQDLLAIESPWGDSTLVALLGDRAEALAPTLNEVLLPERLSAIWHQDSKDLEVVWTAYDLSGSQKELAERSFDFRFRSKKYKCEFGASSERLLTLAKITVPRSNPSDTNFRNLSSFNTYVTLEDDEKRPAYLDVPRSFWIRKAKVSEKLLVELISTLNFHMSYFDSQSPTVLIHHVEHGDVNPKARYVRGHFPASITARTLDENLLSFWAGAPGNEMMRFILYYRVIEYAAFHYIDVKARQKLRKLLLDPMCGQDTEKAIEKILDALDAGRADDVPRFNDLLTYAVEPDIVWREIENNREWFSKPVRFDGDFSLDPLISKSETEATFATGGMIKFADTIRKIRNVLAHGRDQRTAKVITPTLRNLTLLRPWVYAIQAAAGEVILYESAA